MSYKVFKITVKSGKEAIWITDQCSNLEEAKAGAIEKFGADKVVSVEFNSTTCPQRDEDLT